MFISVFFSSSIFDLLFLIESLLYLSTLNLAQFESLYKNIISVYFQKKF